MKQGGEGIRNHQTQDLYIYKIKYEGGREGFFFFFKQDKGKNLTLTVNSINFL